MPIREVDRVELRTWVKVAGFVPDAESVFHFVPEDEVDSCRQKISLRGVLGRAMMGARVGDTVRVKVHEDQLELTVLELGREGLDRGSTPQGVPHLRGHVEDQTEKKL